MTMEFLHKVAEAKQRSTPILGLDLNSDWGQRERVDKSKSLSWENVTWATRSWQGTGIWTHVLLSTRHVAHIGSLGGTGGNSSSRRRMLRALENRTQTADYPSRITTRPHANSLEPALHTTASENRRRHSLEANGTCKRLLIVSRGVTNEWTSCKRLKTHSNKFDAVR